MMELTAPAPQGLAGEPAQFLLHLTAALPPAPGSKRAGVSLLYQFAGTCFAPLCCLIRAWPGPLC